MPLVHALLVFLVRMACPLATAWAWLKTLACKSHARWLEQGELSLDGQSSDNSSGRNNKKSLNRRWLVDRDDSIDKKNSSMVRKHSPRRCRLGGPKGPLSTFQREVGARGVFEAFERSKNAFLEKVSKEADIISLDLFESELGFSESSIQDLSWDFFSSKKNI